MNEHRTPYTIRTAPLPIVSAAYHEPDADTYTHLSISIPGQDKLHTISTGCFWNDIVLARSYIKGLGYDRYIQSSTVDNLIMDMSDQQIV